MVISSFLGMVYFGLKSNSQPAGLGACLKSVMGDVLDISDGACVPGVFQMCNTDGKPTISDGLVLSGILDKKGIVYGDGDGSVNWEASPWYDFQNGQFQSKIGLIDGVDVFAGLPVRNFNPDLIKMVGYSYPRCVMGAKKKLRDIRDIEVLFALEDLAETFSCLREADAIVFAGPLVFAWITTHSNSGSMLILLNIVRCLMKWFTENLIAMSSSLLLMPDWCWLT